MPNDTTYEKTTDPNIFIRTERVKSNILLTNIQEQINRLNIEISSFPEWISYPPGASVEIKMVIDYWNETNAVQAEKNNLIKTRDELQTLYDYLVSL